MTPETMDAVVQTPEPEEGGGRWRRRVLVGIGMLCLLSLGYSVGASAEDPKAKPEAQPRNDSALRAQLSDARTENEDLAAQIDALERDNATLEKDNALLEGDKATLEGDNAELEDEVATLEDEVAALETENADLKDAAEQPAPAPDTDSALQGVAPQGTKHVKVVVHADTAADYSAYDDKYKVSDSMQVSGDRTFEYDLPAKDGLDVDMMAEDGSYVSIQVYENGALVAEDEDSSGMGWAYVSY